MRLIDADKLRHELIMGHDLVGAKYTDMADTVDAIPIEWISKQIYEHSNDETLYANLLWLLRKWYWEEEKENEIN